MRLVPWFWGSATLLCRMTRCGPRVPARRGALLRRPRPRAAVSCCADVDPLLAGVGLPTPAGRGRKMTTCPEPWFWGSATLLCWMTRCGSGLVW